MKTKITYNRIWLIAYPIILGSIAQNLINFTDTAFLGRVGEIALGAGALGGLFYLAIIMLGLGFGTGAQIIMARRYGENNLKQIGSVVEHSLIFLLPLALLVFSLMYFFSSSILENAVSSRAVYEGTVAFLKYRAFGIFFAFTNLTFRAFYVGITRTRVITYTTFVLAIVNIILDYLLIFGKFGFPEMGITGAALASVLAEVVATIFFFSYTFIFIDFKKFNLFHFVKPSIEKMYHILRVSLPTMLQSFFSLSVWFVFFLIIEKLGESALAVSNIIRSVFVILLIPIWGFAAATNSLVSQLIGQGRSDEVLSLIYKIVRLCFIGVLAIVSIGVLFPRFILSIYTNDRLLIEMGIPLMYIVSGGALLLSVGLILFNGVTGTGKTQISLAMEMVVLAIYLTYAYAMAHFFNAKINVVWTAELLYGTLMSAFSFIYLHSNRWKSARI